MKVLNRQCDRKVPNGTTVDYGQAGGMLSAPRKSGSNGNIISVSYRTWYTSCTTPAKLVWGIDTVTDTLGRVISFTTIAPASLRPLLGLKSAGLRTLVRFHYSHHIEPFIYLRN